MMVTPPGVVMVSPGTVSSVLPPLAAAMSTMTVPGRIASTAARSRRMGERRPGMFAVVMTMSAPAASRA